VVSDIFREISEMPGRASAFLFARRMKKDGFCSDEMTARHNFYPNSGKVFRQ
jgi:hypothetical protein